MNEAGGAEGEDERAGGAGGGRPGLVLGGAAGVGCRGDELRRDVGGEAEGLQRHKRTILRSEENTGGRRVRAGDGAEIGVG